MFLPIALVQFAKVTTTANQGSASISRVNPNNVRRFFSPGPSDSGSFAQDTSDGGPFAQGPTDGGSFASGPSEGGSFALNSLDDGPLPQAHQTVAPCPRLIRRGPQSLGPAWEAPTYPPHVLSLSALPISLRPPDCVLRAKQQFLLKYQVLIKKHQMLSVYQ